jgi:hypothetical protein
MCKQTIDSLLLPSPTDVDVKTIKRLITENKEANGKLNTKTFQCVILQHRNTPDRCYKLHGRWLDTLDTSLLGKMLIVTNMSYVPYVTQYTPHLLLNCFPQHTRYKSYQEQSPTQLVKQQSILPISTTLRRSTRPSAKFSW